MDELKQIGDFISQIGFPIFVCLYLIFRFEKTLNLLDNSIKELIILIKTNSQ